MLMDLAQVIKSVIKQGQIDELGDLDFWCRILLGWDKGKNKSPGFWILTLYSLLFMIFSR
jgi:hypothetical protein